MLRFVWFWLVLGCDNNVKGTVGAGVGESCAEDRCQSGLVCGHDGTCAEEGELGTLEEGGDCSATLECLFGLVCSAENVCVAEGADGAGGAGDVCGDDTDCQAGHYCGDDRVCVDIGLPYWEGAACPEDDDVGEFRVLFDVPDLPASGEIDFYALPFPNDTRLGASGRPDLSGFPDPGGETAVAELVETLEQGWGGWGTNPTVYFRFSHAHDLSSVTLDTIRFVSIDEDASDYGDVSGFQYFTRNSRGKYICQNWLAVSVYDGRPLEEGHTYAVWVTKGITDEAGVTAVRDNGMKVMLQEERPADLTLARAWDVYGDFREFLVREGIDSSTIAGAAVFTTGYPSRGTRYFREVTAAAEVALASDPLVACDTGVVSPCDDGGARACAAADPNYTEVHGRLSLPRYQVDGGSVSFDSSSLRPIVQASEDVCFALTVPNETAPAAGWPVAVYAPDVGGTFRDAVTSGLAGALAAEGVGTLTLELPGHGERGDSYIDPEHFAAWLGNQLQATADPNAALRLLDQGVAAEQSPTGAAITFDPENYWFVGQGEGASTGMNFLAWTLDVKGGVLGNPAAYGVHRFADESEPVDVEHLLMAQFADTALSRWHPMVSLLQQAFEPADPVNNGLGIVREPLAVAKHLLVVHGVDDTQTPAGSLRSALRALYLPTAGSVTDDYGQSTTTFPVFENVSTDDGRKTAASVQVAAGHDALLEPEGLDRAAAFIGSGTGGLAPTIAE